ncbi:recombinase family protein [Kitasatospora sp. NPDC088264]|uniref:recombinase family protein n=1 Tax=Kitasatospora sp. NPDC088264 TaxID=3155296 RepID=UPI0034279F9B
MAALAPVRETVGSRVSDTHGDEGKISHLVQAESATRHAVSKEWEIVGSFEALDVSAEITPWKRPDLGPWLTERQGEWDAMVWAEADRAFRSAKDCADVAHWAEENRKVLVVTDDGITFDCRESSFGNELAKVFLMLASIFGNGAQADQDPLDGWPTSTCGRQVAGRAGSCHTGTGSWTVPAAAAPWSRT